MLLPIAYPQTFLELSLDPIWFLAMSVPDHIDEVAFSDLLIDGPHRKKLHRSHLRYPIHPL
jgi:hypothetical protein